MLKIGKKLNAIIAIEIIMTMTLYYFIYVGMTAVSYAIDVVKTNNTNIEFSAYFQNENGEKVENKEVNIDKEEYLYVDVSVKNEGYFNGEIKLVDNNFNIKTDKLSEGIAEIKDNVVTLNQINAGSTVTIKLAIEAKKEDSIKSAILNGKTKVELEGKYINSKNVEKDKYIEIKGEDEVELKWKSEEATNVELGGRLLTNSIYEVNGENKRLVQMLVNSKITNNNYPIKNTEITLNVPEAVEEVTVKARSTEATNKNVEFGEGNYEYNRDEKKLTIKVGNEDPENISWDKEGQDTFVVTYILNPKNNIANEDINIEDKINLYDDKEITGSQNVHIEEEIDGVISGAIESSENEIYKGKIYTGEERDYTETNKVNIDYIEVGDKVEIEQKEATYVGEQERQANIIYKETKIRKDEFQKIFGEEGYITIKDVNGTVLADINKDTEANEEGKIVITYSTVEKEIKMEASKPVTEGTLNIENTKAILNSGYGREEIQRINGIKEKMTVNSKVAEKVITLKETETAGNIMTDVSKISTVADKQTITIGATLDSKGESKNLYKNPTITIKLPKEMTLQTAQYAALYKNGLTVESTNTSKNENGETEVTIKLKGEQTSYDISGGTKVLLKLDVTTNKLTPSKASQIAMTYTNENTSEEKTAIANINFESQYGIMIYNQMVHYNNNGETLVTVDKTTAKGELSTNVEQKDLTLSTALVNNYGEDVTDVTLIGKIPADTSREGYVAKLSTLQTNNEKLKIYYTNKQDAQANDESWGDYREDATSYKIVIDKMDKEEVIKFNVPVTIPENLKYNKTGDFVSVVSCNYEGNMETNSSNIVLSTTSGIENGSVVEKPETTVTKSGLTVAVTTISGNQNLANNDSVYEGQTIKYKVTITNNTGKDYTNVGIKATQKNGYVWDWVASEVYNYFTGQSSIEHYYEVSTTNEINLGTIETLKDGESYSYVYESNAYDLDNENIDGTQTYGTISMISEDKTINETINTVKSTIKESEIALQLVPENSKENQWLCGAPATVGLRLLNKTDETLNNVEVKVVFSNALNLEDAELKNIFYINDEENVEIKNATTNSEGETIVTLSVKSIEKGIAIEIPVSAPIKEFAEREKTIKIMASATTEEENLYYSNQIDREAYNLKNNIEVKHNVFDENNEEINENTTIDNGKNVKIVGTVTNKEDHTIKTTLTYVFGSALSINKITLIGEDGTEDLTDQVQNEILVTDTKEIPQQGILKLVIDATIDTSKASDNKVTGELTVFDVDQNTNERTEISFLANKTEGTPDAGSDNKDIDVVPNPDPDPNPNPDPDKNIDSDNNQNPDPDPDPDKDSNVNPDPDPEPSPDQSVDPDPDLNPDTDGNTTQNPNPTPDVDKDQNLTPDINPLPTPGNTTTGDTTNSNTTTPGSNSNTTNGNGNNGNNGNGQSSGNDTNITKYTVKGIVWVDKNKDGKRSNDEEKLSNITVYAMSATSGSIVSKTSTNEKGEYNLSLEEGKYIIIFFYDNTMYNVTTYQVSGANENENSDAISRTMDVDNREVTVGATDEIEVNGDLSNIDIGLVNKNKFELGIKKTVSKITISNDSGTKIKEYSNTTLAKAEIKAKDLQGTTVVIEYKITVTNKGQIAGYAKDIVDYKPKDLKFNSGMNSSWYQSGDYIHTTSLSNTRIEPGETKELTLILTKTMTESNTGLTNNKAEITSTSNEQDIDNESKDKGSADVIISVSTGALVGYVGLTLTILVVLCVGAYLINRRISRGEKRGEE